MSLDPTTSATSSHYTTTERLISSLQAKPGGFHRFRLLKCLGKGRNIFSHPKLQTIDSLLSTINDHHHYHYQNPLIEIYQNLSFLARDLAEKVPLAWATRATRVFFFYIISREFQGYFYFFLYSDTQVILWTFKGILFEFLYIYLYFCFVFFGNAPNKYKEEWQHKSNTQFIPSLYTGSKLNS